MRSLLALLLVFGFILGCAAPATNISPDTGKNPENTQEEPNPSVEGDAFLKALEFYDQRYNLTNPYQKLVDNFGEGYEDLYGVRNFRMVLKGILYRGGANNYYHRTHMRDNENPLPNDGLQNLCEEGFSKALYMYTTNFSTAPKLTNCQDIRGQSNEVQYLQFDSKSATGLKNIMKTIYNNITNYQGPIYLHCWNGWHASGLASATSLIQFCGWSAENAVKYWDQNTDGANKGSAYDRIRKLIRNFKPYSEYVIDQKTKDLICPQ